MPGILAALVAHDNGAVWTQFVGASGPPNEFDIYRDQGTYNSIVSVNPTDPESIFIGGIDVWRWNQTVNNPPSGGFEKVSQWFVNPTTPIYVHADNHEMQWDANNRLYVGNDGGVGVTEDFAQNWYPANRGYNVTQFYGIAYDKSGAVMGGTQDNGNTVFQSIWAATFFAGIVALWPVHVRRGIHSLRFPNDTPKFRSFQLLHFDVRL